MIKTIASKADTEQTFGLGNGSPMVHTNVLVREILVVIRFSIP